MKYLFCICNCCSILTLLPVKRLIDSTVGKDAGCHGPRRALGMLCRTGEEAAAVAIGGGSSGLPGGESVTGSHLHPALPCPAPHTPGHFSHPVGHWRTRCGQSLRGCLCSGACPLAHLSSPAEEALSQPWSQEEDAWSPAGNPPTHRCMKVSKCLLSDFSVLVVQYYHGRLPREH